MPERPPPPSRKWLVGLGLLIVIGLIVYGLRVALHDNATVRTAIAKRTDMSSNVSTNGRVEPVEEFQAHATAPGVVQKVSARVGQHVSQGAELIRMDDSEARKNVAAAQASLQLAESTLRNMQGGGSADELLSSNADLATAKAVRQQDAAALTSREDLLAKGAASAGEVASAKQKLADDDARIAQLQTRRQGRYNSGELSAQQAQVAQARAALSAAQNAVSSVDFRAPFAGTVYAVPVNDFDYVQSGEALMNMADLTRVQVRAYFDEPEIGKLAKGQPVKIEWAAKPGIFWHGHITLAPTTVIQYGTRNVGEAIISVDDAKGDLLPNTNVTVTVTTSQKMDALSLPREALYAEGTQNFVYRIVDGRLTKTAVQIGTASNLTRIEIGSGLKEGDVVALPTAGGVEFKDGLQVEVKAAT